MRYSDYTDRRNRELRDFMSEDFEGAIPTTNQWIVASAFIVTMNVLNGWGRGGGKSFLRQAMIRYLLRKEFDEHVDTQFCDEIVERFNEVRSTAER